MKETPLNLSPVEPLAEHHELESFSCGKHPLDYWLKRHARTSDLAGGGRVHVRHQHDYVKAFYAITTSTVEFAEASPEMQDALSSNYPISTILITRLAVDRTLQGMGVGGALLADALRRSLMVTNEVGAKAVIVHAMDDDAKSFYLRYRFREMSSNPMHLFHLIKDIAASLS